MRSVGSGVAACAAIWIICDMFWGYKIATAWSRFLLMSALASLALTPYFYCRGKRLTKCSKCGAAWSKSRSERELIRTITKPRETEWHMKEFWQYWTCGNCGDQTRVLEREGNTQKGD